MPDFRAIHQIYMSPKPDIYATRAQKAVDVALITVAIVILALIVLVTGRNGRPAQQAPRYDEVATANT